MTRMTFITQGDVHHEVEAEVGLTVRDIALRNDIPGILGECGGACSCATCHVHVDDRWLSRLGERGEQEAALLAFVENASPSSRLSCQIVTGEALDGLVLHVP